MKTAQTESERLTLVENTNLINTFRVCDLGFDSYMIIDPVTNMWAVPHYHSNWNHLMLVVEKIEGLGYAVESIGNYCKVIGANIQCSQATKIQATYKAVIEFINWYNNLIK